MTFNTGALSFENDPSSIILIFLAALSALSTLVSVVHFLFYLLAKRNRKSCAWEYITSVAPILFILSILVEDLIQVIIYAVITMSLSDLNPSVILVLSKGAIMIVGKIAELFDCNRLKECVKKTELA